MTPETLTTCINCGHQISRRADQCPNCKSPNISCRICNKPIKREDLITHGFRKLTPLHPVCLTERFRLPHSLCCYDCRRPLQWPAPADITRPWSQNWSSCPSCGAPDPLTSSGNHCRTCELPILEAFQKVEVDYIGEYSRPRYHAFCRPDLQSYARPFPDWDDGFNHWMRGGDWYSDAPPPAQIKKSGCMVGVTAATAIGMLAVSLWLVC